MRKWVVIYSSVTGNTKIIAEEIAAESGADVFRVQDAPSDLSAYDVVALGYWLRRGGPDDLMKAYLPTVTHARAVFFQTHGADVGSEHAVTSFARAGCLLGTGCTVLGTFSAQGKLAPALIERRKKSTPDDTHNSPEAQERWMRAADHPNADDRAAAREFVHKMEHKLDLLEKFRRAQDSSRREETAKDAHTDYAAHIFFPIGAPNDTYAAYFSGRSWLAPIAGAPLPIYNVTFEPGCRNNWHIHHAKEGGGQMLICVGGRGWYQAEGAEPTPMTPGTIVTIPPNVRHWHGAAKDSYFSHLAFEIPGIEPRNEWCEPVRAEDYAKLP